MPITPERWILNLLDVATSIADRRMQEDKWATGAWNIWEHPDELINTTGNYALDDFSDVFLAILSSEQKSSAEQFRDDVNHFCASSSNTLDPAELLSDPNWKRVRQSAAGFIQAFAGKWPAPCTEDRARELIAEWMDAMATRNAKANN